MSMEVTAWMSLHHAMNVQDEGPAAPMGDSSSYAA